MEGARRSRARGGPVPFYLIEFDKGGNCTSPVARDELVKASRDRSDVFLFSHGWNNDWDAATNRYDRFIERFTEVRGAHWSPATRTFAPVLAGVIWPSTALVAPWEQGPDIAAAAGVTDADVAALAEELDPDARAQLLQIATAPELGDEQELAKLLAPVLSGRDEDLDADADPATAEQLLGVWNAVDQRTRTDAPKTRGGFIEDDPPGAVDAPAAAVWNPVDRIRKAIRVTTVLLMKDRAGRVGGRGVAEMLRMLLDEDPKENRIALIGHSYGCKVVLSALCTGLPASRKVDSVLLLEPALSCYAFTDNFEGTVGGYRSALDRVKLPIISTRSTHDAPLRNFFHLAVRRDSDIAEAVIAAGAPPSKFAALGGYGPQGVAADDILMPAVGEKYMLDTPNRIIGVDGSTFISDHGAVETPESAWALLSQVQA